MASAKLMASSTSRNAELKRKSSSSSSTKSSSISDPQIHHQNSINKNNSSAVWMTVDGILRNVYADNNRASTANTLLDAEITLLDSAGAVTSISENEDGGGISRQESATPKTVGDVWREIVAGRRENRECKQEAPEDNEMMTLEEFLAKADAVEGEGVKVELPTERLSGGIFAFDQGMIASERSGECLIGYGNEVEEIGGGRGKRTLLEPLDKAAQQRQRRMIKNRESAARSRERKQAYQVELEAMAVKLEEENELLLKEKAQRTKERLKQLMEKVVPVVEKRNHNVFFRGFARLTGSYIFMQVL